METLDKISEMDYTVSSYHSMQKSQVLVIYKYCSLLIASS